MRDPETLQLVDCATAIFVYDLRIGFPFLPYPSNAGLLLILTVCKKKKKT